MEPELPGSAAGNPAAALEEPGPCVTSPLSPGCPQAPPSPVGVVARGVLGGVPVSPPSVTAAATSGASSGRDPSPAPEAPLRPGSLQAVGRARRERRLDPGDSRTPGVPTSVPTSSSVSLSPSLPWWPWDAEELLHDLGFVGRDPGVAARIPPRFFSAPSRASGIDLGLFLRAQERRRRMEEPSLQLAGRFQQLQALAATADAFLCLYCHVSGTPRQRIAPPRPYRDIPDRSQPGQRLRSAVSSLCLCTAATATGDSDSDSGRGETLGGLREDPRDVPEGPGRDAGVWGLGGDTRDPRGGVTVSPQDPAHPEGRRHRGQRGLGATERGGGHPRGLETPGRDPGTLEHRGEEETVEMEVLSEEEENDDEDEGEDDDEDDEDDDEEEEEEAACSPHASITT